MWNEVVVTTHAKTNTPSERAYGTEIEHVKTMYVEGGSSEKYLSHESVGKWVQRMSC